MPSTIRPGTSLLLVLMLLMICLPSAALGRGRIVSVQSISISPYGEAIDGFSEVCTLPLDRLLMSDSKSASLEDRIRRLEPELILAVGLDALKALDGIHDIPIVFVMLLCTECESGGRANITGVNMTPSVSAQLGRVREILPDVRDIGVVFNPEKTGQLVEKASTAAEALGIDILAVPVTSAREVPVKLESVRDQAETIWMIPDMTVMTRQTVEFFLLYSMENKIPLIAFSEKYVDMGAFMAFGLDPKDMGRQAGEMANAILSGMLPAEVPVQEARKVSVTVNRTLAKKFGIQLNENQLEAVKIVE